MCWDDRTRDAFAHVEQLLAERPLSDTLHEAGYRPPLPLALEGIQRQLLHLEGLLKQHEDLEVLRRSELMGLLAGLPERYRCSVWLLGWRLWTFTVEAAG